MPKIYEKHSRGYNQKSEDQKLYDASAITQEMQAFPKTESQAVKIDVTQSFEIKAENCSLLNKVLRMTAYANCFIKI